MQTILVADDELEFREILKELLTENGFAVETAVDGKQALEKIHNGKFDLIILDLHMPDIQGIDILRVIRNSPLHQKLPVLICSSEGVFGRIEEAFKAGADGYILKPFHFEKVIEKVKQALKKT